MNSNNESENNSVESDVLKVDDAAVEDHESPDENTGMDALLPTGSFENVDVEETSSPEESDSFGADEAVFEHLGVAAFRYYMHFQSRLLGL